MLVNVVIVEKRVRVKTYDVDYDFEALQCARNEYDCEGSKLMENAEVDMYMFLE